MAVNKPLDTEDKTAYCKYGEKMETIFCLEVAPLYGLEANINPEKENNKYAVDLIVEDFLVDLKTVREPFFTAGKYKKNPSTCITINKKDIDHYKGRDIYIFFWVKWDSQERFGVRVSALDGVWCGHINKIIGLCTTLHEYKNRKNDTSGNGKSSYIIDTDDLKRLNKK